MPMPSRSRNRILTDKHLARLLVWGYCKHGLEDGEHFAAGENSLLSFGISGFREAPGGRAPMRETEGHARYQGQGTNGYLLCEPTSPARHIRGGRRQLICRRDVVKALFRYYYLQCSLADTRDSGVYFKTLNVYVLPTNVHLCKCYRVYWMSGLTQFITVLLSRNPKILSERGFAGIMCFNAWLNIILTLIDLLA
jgi:hypothetical protein